MKEWVNQSYIFIPSFHLFLVQAKIFLIFLFILNFHFCSYEVLLTLDKGKHMVDGPIYYYLFNTLLFCLLYLHIYWWMLMMRMLIRQVQARGQISDDVRSGKKVFWSVLPHLLDVIYFIYFAFNISLLPLIFYCCDELLVITRTWIEKKIIYLLLLLIIKKGWEIQSDLSYNYGWYFEKTLGKRWWIWHHGSFVGRWK